MYLLELAALLFSFFPSSTGFNLREEAGDFFLKGVNDIYILK